MHYSEHVMLSPPSTQQAPMLLHGTQAQSQALAGQATAYPPPSYPTHAQVPLYLPGHRGMVVGPGQPGVVPGVVYPQPVTPTLIGQPGDVQYGTDVTRAPLASPVPLGSGRPGYIMSPPGLGQMLLPHAQPVGYLQYPGYLGTPAETHPPVHVHDQMKLLHTSQPGSADPERLQTATQMSPISRELNDHSVFRVRPPDQRTAVVSADPAPPAQSATEAVPTPSTGTVANGMIGSATDAIARLRQETQLRSASMASSSASSDDADRAGTEIASSETAVTEVVSSQPRLKEEPSNGAGQVPEPTPDYTVERDRYRCNVCNYCSHRIDKINEHMEAHKDGKHICHICQKAFIKGSDVKRHMVFHDKFRHSRNKTTLQSSADDSQGNAARGLNSLDILAEACNSVVSSSGAAVSSTVHTPPAFVLSPSSSMVSASNPVVMPLTSLTPSIVTASMSAPLLACSADTCSAVASGASTPSPGTREVLHDSNGEEVIVIDDTATSTTSAQSFVKATVSGDGATENWIISRNDKYPESSGLVISSVRSLDQDESLESLENEDPDEGSSQIDSQGSSQTVPPFNPVIQSVSASTSIEEAVADASGNTSSCEGTGQTARMSASTNPSDDPDRTEAAKTPDDPEVGNGPNNLADDDSEEEWEGEEIITIQNGTVEVPLCYVKNKMASDGSGKGRGSHQAAITDEAATGSTKGEQSSVKAVGRILEQHAQMNSYSEVSRRLAEASSGVGLIPASHPVPQEPRVDNMAAVHPAISAALATPTSTVCQRRLSTGEFPCSMCNYQGRSMKSLKKHVRAHYQAYKICKYCGKAFERPSDLLRHEERHELKMQKSAGDPSLISKGKIVGKIPLTVPIQDRVFRCKKCDFETWEYHKYALHQRTKHSTKYPCTKCGMTFISWLPLSNHMKRCGQPGTSSATPHSGTIATADHQNTTTTLPLPVLMVGKNTDTASMCSPESVVAKQRVPTQHEPTVARMDFYYKNCLRRSALVEMELGEPNEILLSTSEVEDEVLFAAKEVPGCSSVNETKALIASAEYYSRKYQSSQKPQYPSATAVRALPQDNITLPRIEQTTPSTMDVVSLSGVNVVPATQAPQTATVTNTQANLSPLMMSPADTSGEATSESTLTAPSDSERNYIEDILSGSTLVPTTGMSKSRPRPSLAVDVTSANTKPMTSPTRCSPRLREAKLVKREPQQDQIILSPPKRRQRRLAHRRPQIHSSEPGTGDLYYTPLKVGEHPSDSARVKKDVEYYCARCNYGTNAKNKFQQHMTVAHMGKYICRYCHRACLKSTDLYRHWVTHNIRAPNGEYACDSCLYTHPDRTGMESHMRVHYAQRIGSLPTSHGLTKCGICHKTFQRSQLFTHKRLVHGNRKTRDMVAPSFKPTQTSQQPRQQTRYGRYLRPRNTEVSYACPICDEAFSSATEIQHHYDAMHATDTADVVGAMTSDAGASSQTEDDEISEVQLVVDDRPTPATANTRPAPMPQRRRAGGGGRYRKTCSFCGKRFKTGSYLKQHMRLHTGEKPYSCSDCGTAFALAQTLQKHRERKCSGTRNRGHITIENLASMAAVDTQGDVMISPGNVSNVSETMEIVLE